MSENHKPCGVCPCCRAAVNRDRGKRVRPKQTQRELPEPRILSGADVIRVLGRQVFEDAREAKWLKACCVKETEGGALKSFYARRAVEEVMDRMECGEYPGQSPR